MIDILDIILILFLGIFLKDGRIGSPEFPGSSMPFSPELDGVPDLNFPDNAEFHNILNQEVTGMEQVNTSVDSFARYFPNSYVSN